MPNLLTTQPADCLRLVLASVVVVSVQMAGASQLAPTSAVDPDLLPQQPLQITEFLGDEEPVYGVDLDSSADVPFYVDDAIWGTDNAVRNLDSASAQTTGTPTGRQAPTRPNRRLGGVLGGYVNRSNYVAPQGQTIPGVGHRDPPLYRDPSLLSTEVADGAKSLLHRVLTPPRNEQTGEVRFSVFGFGSFSLERSSSDGRPRLDVYDADTPTRQVMESTKNLNLNSTTVHTDPGVTDGSEFQSDIVWLWDAMRKNWIAAIVLFVTLIVLMKVASRLYGDRRYDEESAYQSEFHDQPQRDVVRRKVRKKKRRRRSGGNSRPRTPIEESVARAAHRPRLQPVTVPETDEAQKSAARLQPTEVEAPPTEEAQSRATPASAHKVRAQKTPPAEAPATQVSASQASASQEATSDTQPDADPSTAAPSSASAPRQDEAPAQATAPKGELRRRRVRTKRRRGDKPLLA